MFPISISPYISLAISPQEGTCLQTSVSLQTLLLTGVDTFLMFFIPIPLSTGYPTTYSSLLIHSPWSIPLFPKIWPFMYHHLWLFQLPYTIRALHMQSFHGCFSNYKHVLRLFFFLHIPIMTTQMQSRKLFPWHRKTSDQWWRCLRTFLKFHSPVGKSYIERQCYDHEATVRPLLFLLLLVRPHWGVITIISECSIALCQDFHFLCLFLGS